MNKGYSLRENCSIPPKRKTSLDFSRHLCDAGGRRVPSSMEKRPSKSFSDSDTVGLMRHLKQQGGDVKRKNALSMGQMSLERGSNKQMYHMDTKFHRKYGSKCESDDGLVPVQVPNRTLPTCSLHFGGDDEEFARSFCDSVSSVACSHFTNVNGLESERPKESRYVLSDKVSKFSAIESWLQGISRPLL